MNLSKIQQGVTQFASDSKLPGHVALTCVHFDGATATATDSFRLVQITNIAPNAPEASAPVLIDAKNLAAIKTKKDDAIIIEGTSASTGTGPIYPIGTEAAPADYPKVQSLIDEAQARKGLSIDVSGEYLAEIAKHLAKLSPLAGKVTLHLPDVENRPLLITASGNGHEAIALLMPLTR